MAERLFNFVGGTQGPWKVITLGNVIGPGLPPIERLAVLPGQLDRPLAGCRWLLRGVTSSERYVHRHEQDTLKAVQPPLGRPTATCAALIPVKKTAAWWELPQDERRAIFETRSHHIETGLKYLPAIARRLHHGYDLGEPFDFLTWFEYAPADADAFEALVAALRSSEEWQYVEREVDIRFVREAEGQDIEQPR
jgi:chlorite dismutase